MKAVHECEICGQACDCDFEDVEFGQPDICVHLTIAGMCEEAEYEEDWGD